MASSKKEDAPELGIGPKKGRAVVGTGGEFLFKVSFVRLLSEATACERPQVFKSPKAEASSEASSSLSSLEPATKDPIEA